MFEKLWNRNYHDYFKCPDKKCAICNTDCEKDVMDIIDKHKPKRWKKRYTKLLQKKYPLELINRTRHRINSINSYHKKNKMH